MILALRRNKRCGNMLVISQPLLSLIVFFKRRIKKQSQIIIIIIIIIIRFSYQI